MPVAERDPEPSTPVREEVDMLMERLKGEVEPERTIKIIEVGAEPLKDLIAASTPS
ncbi:MAG: hypothetical protein M9938_04215 [Solirubrobacterales bacterium]|nr:hypothetical protein [Solirubrobacterales bacterium]